jgi:predicted SPOUT superfamily RNA methylase MTH1
LATKELAVLSQQHTSHTYFFTREFLTKNNVTVIQHPAYISLFSRLKINRHFDTIEVIGAVLNALTEHDFQDLFKKMT